MVHCAGQHTDWWHSWLCTLNSSALTAFLQQTGPVPFLQNFEVSQQPCISSSLCPEQSNAATPRRVPSQTILAVNSGQYFPPAPNHSQSDSLELAPSYRAATMYLNTRQIYNCGWSMSVMWAEFEFTVGHSAGPHREATPGRELDFRPNYWSAKTLLRVMITARYQELPRNHCCHSTYHTHRCGVPSELDHDRFMSAASAPAGSCLSSRVWSKAEPSSSSAGWEGTVHCAHGMADTHGVGTSSGCSNIHFHQQKPPNTKIQG